MPHNSKTKGRIHERSTYRTTAIHSEISIFWVRAVCEIWSASYGSKHASQPLPIRNFVRIYTHNLKTRGRIWAFYILNDYSTMGDIYYLGQTWMWDTTGELWLQTRIAELDELESYGPRFTSVVLWCNLMCVYTASLFIHHYLVGNYLCQQNSNILWMHTTHQTTASLPTMHRFTTVKNFLSKLIASWDGPVKSTETKQEWRLPCILRKNRGKERLEDYSTSVAWLYMQKVYIYSSLPVMLAGRLLYIRWLYDYSTDVESIQSFFIPRFSVVGWSS